MAAVVNPDAHAAKSGNGNAIEAEGLAKSYSGRSIVDVEYLAVKQGEVLAILGPNGAGKSTLFRLLALLERPDKGVIRYFGSEVTIKDLASRRKTASVFQRPLLFQGKVRNNVAYALQLSRVERKLHKSRVQAALELVGMNDFADRDVKTLSGGELQRVALARALVLEPEILFLDEPTSNLDVHVRRLFREDVRSVVERLGVTVVLITHDHNEALGLASRLAVIREGRIVQTGSPEDVFARPRDEFVAGFMGVETIWHGKVLSCAEGMCIFETVAGVRVETVSGLRPGSKIAVAMRPEDVALSLRSDEDDQDQALRSSVRNRWPGVVDLTSPAGPLVRVRVRLDGVGTKDRLFTGEGIIVALVTKASAESLQLGPGRPVTVSVKATALHVLSDRAE